MKVTGCKLIILILYIDDILHVDYNFSLLKKAKWFLSQNFGMKDKGKTIYIISIEIHRDRFLELLGLSQKTYISRVLKKFGMEKYSYGCAPILKGNKLNKL